ncbi:MAG: hypothetical protein AB7Q00_05705 [Phycisphaerales bacterium]|nr:MAG: response regulator [Phycisphaerales bacterium]
MPPVARRNSLNLSAPALAKVLAALDAAESAKGAPSAKREASRWPFPAEFVPIGLMHADGTSSEFIAAGRNLSRNGIAVLHNAYLHPGSTCRIKLHHLRKGAIIIRGKILRCIHRLGMIHEIAICFDVPIRVRDFINPDPFANANTLEKVNPEQLQGRVVIIAHDAMESQYIHRLLSATNLAIRVHNEIKGNESSLQSCDLVIVSAGIPGRSPSEIIQDLRDMGALTPVIMVTADSGPLTRQNISGARAQAFLAHPLSQSSLMRACAEWLLIERENWAPSQASGSNAGQANSSAELSQAGALLQIAVSESNVDEATTAVERILNISRAQGFRPLIAIAETALESIKTTGSLKDSESHLTALSAICDNSQANAKSA